MIIFLLIVIAVLIALCIYLARKPVRHDAHAMRLIGQLTIDKHELSEQLAQRNREYSALEEGQQELIDNYENDFLTLNERMEQVITRCRLLEKDRGALLDVLEKHENECLPILGAVQSDLLVHNHASTERCEDNHCRTDRYVDGNHMFTDKTIETTPADG